MIWPLIFRRSRRAGTIDALYGMIVAQARLPVFYSEYGVPDTLHGRFDLLVLHLAMVFRRIRAGGGELQPLGQGIFDRFCLDMDENLREMGVGDLTVPKRMQKLGEAFYGRAQAYDEALAKDDDAVAAAVARNIYGSERTDEGRPLTTYIRDTEVHLSHQDNASFASGQITFPNPASRKVRPNQK
ncbi:MAG: ubiquinol-cytochrome C chaperone [Pseudolabrys sp.]|nr:ubiquinol-cytochrome C chaperone [Pseudolabrys sp.]